MPHLAVHLLVSCLPRISCHWTSNSVLLPRPPNQVGGALSDDYICLLVCLSVANIDAQLVFDRGRRCSSHAVCSDLLLGRVVYRVDPSEPYTLKYVTYTQGDMMVVGPEVLKTVDADTPPSGLVYDVSTPATNGRLAYVDTPQQSMNAFTQEDVNRRKVVFLQDGSSQPGAIYLKVGIRTQLLRLFAIRLTL